jgi:prepilin-type N-terminal cleavage/methylation domain-containing protein
MAQTLPRRKGFTLIELIVVMMVLTVMLTLASPSLRGFFVSRQTADAALTVLALTQRCRSDAIAQGKRYRLNLDADGHNWFITVEKGSDFVAAEGELGQQKPLPEGAHAVFRPTVTGQPASTFVQFYPNGRSDATTVEITGREGDVYLLTAAAPAEPYRVTTPTEGGK